MKLSVDELGSKLIWLESSSTRAHILSKENLEKRLSEIKKKLGLFLKNIEIEIPKDIEEILEEAEIKAKELSQVDDILSQT